jgi:ADP-ribose pyrophosphatase YjhB (NUDIX family)
MPISPYVRDLRTAIGSRRLLLASTAGIVRDQNGAILLVQTTDSGVWTTPGGVIEMDDTPADAVVREVWEETGLLVRPTRLIAVYGGPEFVVRYPNGDESQYISAFFECEIESGSLRPDRDETAAARFWTYEEARELPLSPWLHRVLPRLFDRSTDTWFEAAVWTPLSS